MSDLSHVGSAAAYDAASHTVLVMQTIRAAKHLMGRFM
jgi:hypothetical protein